MTAYCIVELGGGFFGKNVDIDFGEDDALKSRLSEDLLQRTYKVKDFSNGVDALNYMATVGWEFVSIMPYKVIGGSTTSRLGHLMKIEI